MDPLVGASYASRSPDATNMAAVAQMLQARDMANIERSVFSRNTSRRSPRTLPKSSVTTDDAALQSHGPSLLFRTASIAANGNVALRALIITGNEIPFFLRTPF